MRAPPEGVGSFKVRNAKRAAASNEAIAAVSVPLLGKRPLNGQSACHTVS